MKIRVTHVEFEGSDAGATAVLDMLAKSIGPRLIDAPATLEIVAVCDLTACRATATFTQEELDRKRLPPGATSDFDAWTERQMGDFSLGRFGWVLDNIRPLPAPIACRGCQGFWDVDDAAIDFVLRAGEQPADQAVEAG